MEESSNDESAFVETDSVRPKIPKAIKLAMREDGTIDWENTSQKHTKAFLSAVENDPNGILDNIKEQAGQKVNPDAEPTGIADATVLTLTNAVMVVEAVGITSIGTRFVPVLKNLHPVVAIKACTVSLEELKPVMPAAKRIIKRYIPSEYLGQEYQDIAIVGEHLLKLSAQKFKACVDLAMEIERMKASGGKANGHATTIEGAGTIS